MSKTIVLVSIPHFREEDLGYLPALVNLCAHGQKFVLTPTFPCVTCPVQANMTTGKLPSEHGIVGNGLYWRQKNHLEMWTGGNDLVESHQIWDVLSCSQNQYKSAVFFPLHSKYCDADYVLTPAPIHNPDGSETLWCWTRPESLYGELRAELGDFPLMNWWGPMANAKSASWSVEAAIRLARQERPDFFYLYVPHLDYASQKNGPESPEMIAALQEYNTLFERLINELNGVYGEENLLWLFAGEYTIVPATHVTYPNRMLREAGLLTVCPDPKGGELIDFVNTPAFAACDHQFSHVYLKDRSPENIEKIARLFIGKEGFDDILYGDRLALYGLNHERSGELVLVSTPNSWQAYYYWLDEAQAPSFAHTVDIHRKPGYDPCELIFDPAIRGITTDATRIKGTHGAFARDPMQKTMLLTSGPVGTDAPELADVDIFDLILENKLNGSH